ncbi:hypothetical protein ILUMI_20089 [Ignelater luminosus]|uniref:Mutator-like transposase domain-containing protein n=1 Tax=Ignelater luminosus TaxID=2038154 RepID=A0A8K0CH03_IGNLU|nr:hypothetical protein ILUMI_20089 [Ignelater luminosus]
MVENGYRIFQKDRRDLTVRLVRLADVAPERTWKCAETNLTDGLGSKGFLTKRGVKYPEKICNSSKSIDGRKHSRRTPSSLYCIQSVKRRPSVLLPAVTAKAARDSRSLPKDDLLLPWPHQLSHTAPLPAHPHPHRRPHRRSLHRLPPPNPQPLPDHMPLWHPQQALSHPFLPQKAIQTKDSEVSYLNVNEAAVMARIMKGSGYAHMEEMAAALNISCIAKGYYHKLQNKMYDSIHTTAWQQMRKAAEKESAIAIEEGTVDADRIRCIMIIIIKRSNNMNCTTMKVSIVETSSSWKGECVNQHEGNSKRKVLANMIVIGWPFRDARTNMVIWSRKDSLIITL